MSDRIIPFYQDQSRFGYLEKPLLDRLKQFGIDHPFSLLNRAVERGWVTRRETPEIKKYRTIYESRQIQG